MTIKVLTLEGLDSIYPTQGFHKLMLGLKMLPAYLSESYDVFLSRLEGMDEADQEKMIREAIKFVRLDAEEIMDIIKWAVDANGVKYCKENVKNLSPQKLSDIMTAVCLEVAKAHKINLVSDAEKKNLKISRSTSEEHSSNTQISH